MVDKEIKLISVQNVMNGVRTLYDIGNEEIKFESIK